MKPSHSGSHKMVTKRHRKKKIVNGCHHALIIYTKLSVSLTSVLPARLEVIHFLKKIIISIKNNSIDLNFLFLKWCNSLKMYNLSINFFIRKIFALTFIYLVLHSVTSLTLDLRLVMTRFVSALLLNVFFFIALSGDDWLISLYTAVQHLSVLLVGWMVIQPNWRMSLLKTVGFHHVQWSSDPAWPNVVLDYQTIFTGDSVITAFKIVIGNKRKAA